MRTLPYVFREIKNNRSFTLLFVLNLSLGLCGFITLDIFKQSVTTTISEKSRHILGADLGMSARRIISEDEKTKVQKEAPTAVPSSFVEVFSMVATPGGKSLLTQIKAVELNYPFYGAIEKEPGAEELSQTRAWVYPEILLQLGLKKGDSLRLGDQEFKIVGVITNDPSADFSSSLAPRIYIELSDLEKTHLVRTGSIARYTTVFKIPQKSTAELQAIQDKIYKEVPEGDLRIFTHENSSQQMGRMLGYLSDFLGLIALSAIFLSAIGTGFLASAFLQKKLKEMAILISLGLSPLRTFTLFGIHVALMGLISAVVSLTLSFSLMPFLQKITQGLLPFDIFIRFNAAHVILALGAGVLGSLFILLPLLLQLRKLQPSLLFHQQKDSKTSWDLMSLLGTLPSLGIFIALSVVQAHSWKIGLSFSAAFLGTGLVLFGAGYLLLWALNRFYPRIQTALPLNWSWSLRELTRQRLVSLTAFLSLGLGVMMMNVIPQLQASLQEELQTPEHSKVPSLFLFDIQEDQVDALQTLIKNHHVPLNDLSPMIRARLLTHNGQPFDKGSGAANSAASREEQQANESRNRGFNLSFRDNLKPSETIVKGRAFTATAGEEAQISLEERFASRLKMKLGDKLTFDVQGVSVGGTVVNFRSVKWTSFQPNFFVVFQPGFLEGAPKTYLSTLPRLPIDEKLSLQNDIVKDFPNVSLVDVTKTTERITQIVQQMSWALQFMSLLTIAVGLGVLFSLAHHQARQKQNDIGLLKALGAPLNLIEQVMVWPFLLVAAAAGSVGVLASFIISYLFSQLLFENVWIFDGRSPLVILALTLISAGGITYWATRESLKTSPQELLADA